MNRKDYLDTLEASKIIKKAKPELTAGEAFFYILDKSDPEVAELVKDTQYDMRRSDANIEKFKEKFVK